MFFRCTIRLLVLCAITLGVVGCTTPKAPIVWNPDSNESIRHFQQPVVPENHKDYALIELGRGNLFFKHGDQQHSDSRFRNALNVMDQIESDSREAAGTVLAEQHRTYRGQPYERATAYFYRGLSHYQLGHYEQALAAFRATLAEDEETNNEDPLKRKDYLAAYYMQAQCLKALGEYQEAEVVLASARELFPQHPLFASNRPEGTLIVVAGVGYGPWMMQGALWNVEFKAGAVPEGEIGLSSAQTGTAGRLYETTDLLVQADSNEAGSATDAAIARGVTKAVLNAFASALTGRDAGIREHRDLRCWKGMPRKLYIGSFDFPAGLHTLTFAFGDSEKLESDAPKLESDAPRYQQTWHDVPVNNGTTPALLYVQLLPNAQNFNDLVPVPLEDALAAKKEKEAK